ncbi:hypothetical protein GM50_21795 [freshwater metagenome]|uniref:Uncharacterized protein n=1 Tax=freshwater metagenome TaxID=449393 RepID=A0A094QH31_9ZZZZ
MLESFVHSSTLFIHKFLTVEHAFEQGFLTLSTVILVGYYYYLYIQKTRVQTNHTTSTLFFGLSNSSINMKDFRLKKLRANA